MQQPVKGLFEPNRDGSGSVRICTDMYGSESCPFHQEIFHLLPSIRLNSTHSLPHSCTLYHSDLRLSLCTLNPKLSSSRSMGRERGKVKPTAARAERWELKCTSFSSNSTPVGVRCRPEPAVLSSLQAHI